ncbi:MAG: hypothetical protein LUQ57_02250 [Methylococcaceae bacterium]|nr:hypothetical protein [Methylococcaceae bacterium]
MKRCATAILFLALNQAGAAEPPQAPAAAPDAGLNQAPRLTAEHIDRKTGIPPNPGVAADNAKAAATGEMSAPSLENGPKKIGDPTQMTGSFTEALSRIHGKPGGPSGGATAAQPAVPQIELTAKVYLQDSKAAVILKVGDKSHLIKKDEKFSFLDKNMLYEIQVDRIDDNGVTLTVLPLGRKLILQ